MRPIEGEHPYIYLDGIVLKRSWAGEVRNVSLLVATSVNGEGYREILGICEGASGLRDLSLCQSGQPKDELDDRIGSSTDDLRDEVEIQTELGAERRQKEQQCNEEQHAIGLHPRKRDG